MGVLPQLVLWPAVTADVTVVQSPPDSSCSGSACSQQKVRGLRTSPAAKCPTALP